MFQVHQDADGSQRFARLDPAGYLPPFTDLLANRAAMAAGIRAVWRTGGGTLTLAGHGAPDCAPYDVLVNGEPTHRLPAIGTHRHDVALENLEPDSLVQVWLPHFGDFTVQQATFDGGSVTSALESGPRWITYGSSITHCQQADGPTQAWPSVVARRNGWQLSNLGLAGECQLDPIAANTIAQTPADIISLCVGINSYNAATYSERTYAVTLQGFLNTVRRAHPNVPVVVITPVLSLPREDKPNAVGWSLRDYRAATADVVAALQAKGDSKLHLIDGATVLTEQEALERLPDTLHPDTAGYAIMAQRLGPQLAAVL
jgi:lysophospholipase L1-like esterase